MTGTPLLVVKCWNLGIEKSSLSLFFKLDKVSSALIGWVMSTSAFARSPLGISGAALALTEVSPKDANNELATMTGLR